MNKYMLTSESIVLGGITLYRIKALQSFSDVKEGEEGGYIQSEKNLSQFCNAKVSGNAWVYGNAKVYGNAWVCGNAKVSGDAEVSGDAKVYGNAKVSGNAWVYGDAKVSGDAEVSGDAKVSGNAWVYGDAKVSGDAEVSGDAWVYGNAEVSGDAKVSGDEDYIVFKNWWSSGRYFTWTRSNNMWKVGCFFGTGEELIAKAYEDSEVSGREYKRVVRYVGSMLNNKKKPISYEKKREITEKGGNHGRLRQPTGRIHSRHGGCLRLEKPSGD